MTFLTAFDYGRVSQLPDGRVRREYTVIALDQEVEVASGVKFPAWTFNGNIPGPTLRCTEGDLVTIHFLNESSMPHTLHFHGFHPANMDGVFEVVPPGSRLPGALALVVVSLIDRTVHDAHVAVKYAK
jgi:FtsP/CotA-like multicopper oxidase with cupredoxin domain